VNVPGSADQELQDAPRKRLRWWFHLLVLWPAVLAHGLFDATTFVVLALLPGLADRMPQLH
jgi:hypothetical protein